MFTARGTKLCFYPSLKSLVKNCDSCFNKPVGSIPLADPYSVNERAWCRLDSMSSTAQFESAQGGSDGVRAQAQETLPSTTEPFGFRPGWHAWFSFPAMLTALLTLIVFIMARPNFNDPDIWWHLRNAEYLFRFHQLPSHDTFSFTVAGHDWMNYEWLGEIPYYLAWRAGGILGLRLLSFGMVEAIFLGLLYLCYKASGNIKASVAACCVTSFLAVVSFGPRTILFGYALLVLLLIVLERFRRLGRAPLWLLPPLFCLWINTHGSWLLGLAIFGLIAAAGLVEGRWGRIESVRWNPQQTRQLVVSALASVAALFVNPFGYRLLLYPFDIGFRQKLNIAYVAEWVSVNFHDTRGKVVLGLLIALLLASLLREMRWQLADVALLLFGLYFGLTYIRFLFLLAILAAPVLSKLLDFVGDYDPAIDKPLLNALFIAGILGAMIYYFPRTVELEQSIAREYPAEARPYLRAHPPAAPMLNFYLWGGYLGWYDRSLKVFVDSRVDIYEHAGVFQDYIDLLALKNHRGILDKYQIRSVL